jgi:hypothetical protein
MNTKSFGGIGYRFNFPTTRLILGRERVTSGGSVGHKRTALENQFFEIAAVSRLKLRPAALMSRHRYIMARASSTALIAGGGIAVKPFAAVGYRWPRAFIRSCRA